MEGIVAPLPRSDGVACFTRLYLAVTKGVDERLAGVTFADPAFLARLDVVFADLFLTALAGFAGDPARVAARLGAAPRSALEPWDRAAPVRLRRDERAHQPRPPGRARQHLPRARRHARGGIAAARRLRARQRPARDRRGRGEEPVPDRLAADARPARPPRRPHRRRRRDVERQARPRRRLDERRGPVGDPGRRGSLAATTSRRSTGWSVSRAAGCWCLRTPGCSGSRACCGSRWHISVHGDELRARVRGAPGGPALPGAP